LFSSGRARRAREGGAGVDGALDLGHLTRGDFGPYTPCTHATGTETDTYTYDAWGNLVERTGSTSNTRLFVGEELDPDLGLINLRARQYRPETGRFVTIDPLDKPALPVSKGADTRAAQEIASVADPLLRALADVKLSQARSLNQYLLIPKTLSRYGYTAGDPSNLTDPTGLDEAVEESVQYTSVRVALQQLKWIGGHSYCVIKAIYQVLACDEITANLDIAGCVEVAFVDLEICEEEMAALGG